MRKYVFDFHAQQRYMSELQKKNEAVKERLAQYQTILELERAARKEQLMEVHTHLWLYHSGYCFFKSTHVLHNLVFSTILVSCDIVAASW